MQLSLLNLTATELASCDIDGVTQALSFFPPCSRLEFHEATVSDHAFGLFMGELCDLPHVTHLDLSGTQLSLPQCNSIVYMLQ